MKKAFLFALVFAFLILICPPRAVAGPTHIQSCTGGSGSGSIASTTCTFGGNIGAGHLVYACVQQFTTGVTVTFSGDGDTWVSEFTILSAGGTTFGKCAWVVHAIGGAAVVTASFSPNGSFPSIVGDEFSLTGTKDQSDTGSTGQFTTPTSNNVTPVYNGELLLGVISTENAPTLTAGTNVVWVAGAGIGASNLALEYFVQTTAASVNAQFGTSNSADRWQVHIATFGQSGGSFLLGKSRDSSAEGGT